MMGQQPLGQKRCFISFIWETTPPRNIYSDSINPLLDLSDLCKHLTAYYTCIGSPPVDHEILVRMLIVGYCYDVRRQPLPRPRQSAASQPIAYPRTGADQPKHPGAI
jgi:hypothetical protein